MINQNHEIGFSDIQTSQFLQRFAKLRIFLFQLLTNVIAL